MSNTLYQSVTDTILKAWNGASCLGKALDTPVYRSRPASSPERTGINSFLLGIAPFADHRWLTFRQIQERADGLSKDPGTEVLFWKFWEPVGKEEPETPRRVPVLHYYKVWNVGQTEGLEAPPVYVSEPPTGHRRELLHLRERFSALLTS